MRMKVEKLFWIIVSIVIISYIFIIHPTQKNNVWESKSYNEKSKNEMIEISSSKQLSYIYNTKEELEQAQAIMILRNNVELRISVDGETILELDKEPGSKIKTTGKGWSILPLKKEYLNKEILIEITPIYDKSEVVNIYEGDTREILKGMFVEDIIEVLVICVFTFISVILIIVAGTDIGGQGKEQGLNYLGIMALAVAGWRVGEINILRLVLPYDVGWSNTSYISLSIMPLTFSLYFRTGITEKWKKIVDIFCVINIVGIILQLILQVMGIADYSESVEVTHFIIMSLIIIVVSTYIYEKKNKEETGFKESSRIIFLVMAIMTLLSLVLYSITGININVISVVVVFYILILAFDKVEEIRKQSLKNNEVEIYRQLAFVDEMTGLYNRTALEYDLRLYNQKKIERLVGPDPFMNLAIIIVDLNDLKRCNDEYGHDKGDIYIKSVAKVINSIFSDNDKCYRMGGDEFCIIIKEAVSIKINRKINELKYQVGLLNHDDSPFVYKLAAGYAQYDDEIDRLIEDVVKRADENMYAHKRYIKDVENKNRK